MILYLHGFNSSGASAKARYLRAALPSFALLAPTYPAHRPDYAGAALDLLLRQLGKRVPTRQILVIGSSLGGFYGHYLSARYRFRHLYLINPAMHPWRQLEDYLGDYRSHHDDEPFQLTRTHIVATRSYALAKASARCPISLFQERDDQTVPFRDAFDFFLHRANIHCYNGGNHAFTRMDALVHDILQLPEPKP